MRIMLVDLVSCIRHLVTPGTALSSSAHARTGSLLARTPSACRDVPERTSLPSISAGQSWRDSYIESFNG